MEQVLALHDFCADEALLEIGVDHSGCLGGLGSLPDGPGSDLVLSSGEEVDEVQGFVAGLDDPLEHGVVLLLLGLLHFFLLLGFNENVLLIFSRVGDDIPRHIMVDPLLDFAQPFILLIEEILL